MRSANEIIDEIRRIKGLSSDTALGALFGVKQSTVASWRTRNSIPYEEIIAFCVREDISTDQLFIGTEKAVVAEPSTIYLAGISPGEKRKLKLVNMLSRILDEGDEKKIKAVEAQLDLLDPGQKNEGVSNEPDDGAGTKTNCA